MKIEAIYEMKNLHLFSFVLFVFVDLGLFAEALF